MGCFSEKDIEIKSNGYSDNGYPCPKQQLLWRIEDIESWLSSHRDKPLYEMPFTNNVGWSDGRRLNNYEKTYILPGHLSSANEAIEALKIAYLNLASIGASGSRECLYDFAQSELPFNQLSPSHHSGLKHPITTAA